MEILLNYEETGLTAFQNRSYRSLSFLKASKRNVEDSHLFCLFKHKDYSAISDLTVSNLLIIRRIRVVLSGP